MNGINIVFINIEESLNYLKSSYFKKIYNEKKSQINNEEILLNETKNEFNDLKQLFSSQDKIETKMKNNNIKKFVDNRNSFDELENEIKVLYEIFHEMKIMPDEEFNKLIKEIKTFNAFYQIKIVITGLVKLRNISIIGKTELYRKIETYFDNINNDEYKTLDKINEIIDFLKNININININEENISKDNYFLYFFNLLYENQDAINWIMQKKDDDFIALRNFIIDSDKNECLTFEILESQKLIDIFKGLNL